MLSLLKLIPSDPLGRLRSMVLVREYISVFRGMWLLYRNGAAWEAAGGPSGLMTRHYEPTGAPSTK